MAVAGHLAVLAKKSDYRGAICAAGIILRNSFLHAIFSDAFIFNVNYDHDAP